jgi:hypothetical protein
MSYRVVCACFPHFPGRGSLVEEDVDKGGRSSDADGANAARGISSILGMSSDPNHPAASAAAATVNPSAL